MREEGEGGAHGCAVFELLEGVQQDKISLFESKQGHVVALVDDGDEAPVALDHHLQRFFEVRGCGGRVRHRLNAGGCTATCCRCECDQEVARFVQNTAARLSLSSNA